MPLLIDTQSFLWFVENNPLLPKKYPVKLLWGQAAP
jgi:hypothetical protein